MKILETNRLLLRTFMEIDLEPMTQINQDKKVMRYFPDLQNKVQTNEFIKKMRKYQEKYGYSLYAVELKTTKEMIGFVGLLYRAKEDFDAPFLPATEIGWRLSSKYWNQGYATEAASSVLDYAFTKLNLEEIVSFTAVNNQSSRRVMEKIGLIHYPENDFNHSKLLKENPLSRHVLYRLTKEKYLKKF